MSDVKALDPALLKQYSTDFNADRANLVAANAAIILLGGYDSAYTWIVVVLYFTTCHATLIFCGAIGLSRALAGKPFRFPLIGPR